MIHHEGTKDTKDSDARRYIGVHNIFFFLFFFVAFVAFVPCMLVVHLFADA